MALKKQLLIFFVAITALLLPFFLCSCDRKDIDPKDCYGKWVPKDCKSPSKCISLHKDGTVEFFDLNWNDVGATEALHSMPRTGVWQLGSRYENAGGLLFMPAKPITYSIEQMMKTINATSGVSHNRRRCFPVFPPLFRTR